MELVALYTMIGMLIAVLAIGALSAAFFVIFDWLERREGL